MKEGICNQILRIKIVLKGCFNDLKTIYSPIKIYKPVIRSNRSTVYNKKYMTIGVFVEREQRFSALASVVYEREEAHNPQLHIFSNRYGA